MADEEWDDDYEPAPCYPDLTLEVTEPEVLGYLYGPDGGVLATLLDRPYVAFGFQSSRPRAQGPGH